MAGSRAVAMALGSAALSLLGACNPGGEPSEPPAAATTTTLAPRVDDGQLILGALLPLTGSGASLGGPMITAIEAAVRQINADGGVLGRPVRLSIVDEEDEAAIETLVAAGVDAIIGPASSTVALTRLDAAVGNAAGAVTCSPSATALALDDYPDNELFFRTIPSDSLQMTAIARRAEATGVDTVAVGYLDDPYGRDLAEALIADIEARGALDLTTTIGFEPDQENLTTVATSLMLGDPGVIVVLGDADDGGRLLTALDIATVGQAPPQVIVNDAIRTSRQTIQSLSTVFRQRLTGVAPAATAVGAEGPSGFFSAHAVDCVNLIALAAIQSGSDNPARIQANMAAVSVGGSVCRTFADCSLKLADGLQIDYSGASGPVELSTATGDLVRGRFEVFGFDAEGVDQPIPDVPAFEVP